MKRAVYLTCGQTLQDLLNQVADEGWTDLSKVVVNGDYSSGCSGHPEGEYCYCDGGYVDMRLEKRAK
jgi:hypothetical protein